MHRSPYFGQSVEFLQHREYVIGDDFRHVDWKVWARQDRCTSSSSRKKRTSAARCWSMFQQHAYGRGPLNKYEYACTIGGLPGLFDSAATGRRRLRRVRREKSARRADSQQTQSLASGDRGPVRYRAARQDRHVRHLADVAETYPRRGMMVLVSDLLTDPPHLIKGLKLLRQRGHDVLVFHVMDDDELDFPVQRPDALRRLWNRSTS